MIEWALALSGCVFRALVEGVDDMSGGKTEHLQTDWLYTYRRILGSRSAIGS